MTPINVELDQLLLDPNNFRFQGEANAPAIATARFAEPKVQDAAYSRHQEDGLGDLRASIAENGFLEVDRIVVKPHPTADGHPQLYIVIEGNRRVATLKMLRLERDSGIDLPVAVADAFEAVPCVVLENPDRATELAIMGVRHVGGIKEWGGYQGAKLVAILKKEEALTTSQVAARLGLPAQEVNRRFRAYSAVERMREDEEYGAHVTPDHYALMHEAVSIRQIREYFGWDAEAEQFADEDLARCLYQLITPFTDESGTRRKAKITAYTEMRGIKAILANVEATKVLLDLEQPLAAAHAIVLQENERHSWRVKLDAAVSAVGRISFDDFAEIGEETVADLRGLAEKLNKIAQQADLLRQTNE
jgi:hypothetical protein